MCLCLYPAHRSPTPHFSEKEDTTDRPFRELAQTPIPLPPQDSPKGAGRGNSFTLQPPSPHTWVQTSKIVQQLHPASQTCCFRGLSEKGNLLFLSSFRSLPSANFLRKQGLSVGTQGPGEPSNCNPYYRPLRWHPKACREHIAVMLKTSVGWHRTTTEGFR